MYRYLTKEVRVETALSNDGFYVGISKFSNLTTQFLNNKIVITVTLKNKNPNLFLHAIILFCDSALLLLSHFSRVQLHVTPQTAAHQAPLSLGFSRQEHWGGLPFPSPIHESEK